MPGCFKIIKNAKKEVIILTSLLIMVTIIALTTPPVFSDISFSSFDDVNYGTSTSGRYPSAYAYAEITGKVELKVSIDLICSYASATAWARLYKTVTAYGDYWEITVNYSEAGACCTGSEQKVYLKVIDPETGNELGVWSSDIHPKDVAWDGQRRWWTLTSGTLRVTRGKEYIIIIEFIINVEGFAILGHASIDFSGNHYIFVHEVYVKEEIEGGGCPTLYVLNGTEFVPLGTLWIHTTNNSDITACIEINVTTVFGGDLPDTIIFKLVEGYPGLNFSRSCIDYVELKIINSYYAIHAAYLMLAYHCSLGDVTSKLRESDDVRVTLNLSEYTIIVFAIPHNVKGNASMLIFSLEGHNVKTPI